VVNSGQSCSSSSCSCSCFLLCFVAKLFSLLPHSDDETTSEYETDSGTEHDDARWKHKYLRAKKKVIRETHATIVHAFDNSVSIR
jgi:hypothetical protein